jgi:Icc-related predicted phosphoesterase
VFQNLFIFNFSMKKTLKKLLFIGFLISGVFMYLNMVFKTAHFQENTRKTFNTLSSKTNIDVIFYGSSRSFRTFNPLIIDAYSKTISFNLGGEAQRVPITDLILEESLRKTKPKLAILEIHNYSIKFPEDTKRKGVQLRSLDFVSYHSINKLNNVLKYYTPKELLGVYSPLIRNHKKWKYVHFLNLDRSIKTIDYFNRGYLGSMNKFNDDDEKFIEFNSESITPKRGNKTITEEDKKNILNFILLAKQNNVDVLIVSAPDMRSKYHNYTFFDELNSICNEQGVNYINFNDYYKELNIGYDDFEDPGHLNIYGSLKTSVFLSNYINEHYNLPDRSTEELWREYQKQLEPFKVLITPKQERVFEKEINTALVAGAVISSIKMASNKNKYKITLNLSNPDAVETYLSNYTLGVHLFPEKRDTHLLKKWSKKKGWDFDLVNVTLEKQEDSIYFELESSIKNIDKIELFLYHKDGYKGIIGEKLRVDAIDFIAKT